MRDEFKLRLGRLMLCGCTTMAFLSVSPAQAQTAEPAARAADTASSNGTDADIIITARKKDERLLDVPVPVTAITATALTTQNLNNIKDYFSRIPSLQYGGDRVQSLSIRGITTGGATNPTLAILVDDVPFGSATANGASNIPDFDPGILQQIEVLRGPQGTLYGAASLGGLIKYVTRDPDLANFGGRVEIGANGVAYGGLGNSARGSVNVPVINGKVALDVSGFYRRDPAYVDNIDSVTGYRLDNANTMKTWGGRASLLIRPVDALSITLSAMRQRQRSNNSGAVDFASDTNFNGALGDDLLVKRVLGQPSASSFDLYSARIVYDAGFAKLTSVSGWNLADTTPYQDLTSIFGGLLRRFYPRTASVFLINAHHTTRFSQEVRLAGEGPVLDWLVGGFYSVEHANIAQTMQLADSSGALFATPYDGAGPSTYREYAAFGSVTAHVTPQFDIQAGGRIAHNKQDNVQTVVTEATIVPVFGPSTFEEDRTSETPITWSVSPSYHVSKDVMIYARVANGYRPGGTNSLIAGVPTTYNSDRVIDYEIGAKGTTLNRALDFDLSVFRIDWTDIQLQNTAANQFTYTANGGKARSQGIEAASTIRPWRGGNVTLNATVTDAVLSSVLPAAPTGGEAIVGQVGDRLPYSPKFTGNAGFEQSFPLSATVDAFVGFNVNYVGNRYGEFLSSAADPGRVRILMPSYTQVDLRAGFSIDRGWRLDGYVRNLFDQRGVLYATSRGGTDTNTGRYIQPRTIGFVVSGKF